MIDLDIAHTLYRVETPPGGVGGRFADVAWLNGALVRVETAWSETARVRKGMNGAVVVIPRVWLRELTDSEVRDLWLARLGVLTRERKRITLALSECEAALSRTDTPPQPGRGTITNPLDLPFVGGTS